MIIKTIYPVKIKVNISESLKDNLGGLTTFDEDEKEIKLDISTTNGPEYIVHEIEHCIDFISEVIGEDIKGESRAYLSQFIFKRIYDRYLKEKGK